MKHTTQDSYRGSGEVAWEGKVMGGEKRGDPVLDERQQSEEENVGLDWEEWNEKGNF